MSKKKINKTSSFLIYFLTFIVGIVAGFGVLNYINLPMSEDVIIEDIEDKVFYSSSNIDLKCADISNTEVSIHFLELGNKYTGDCTYIKVGEDIDILIDCGSKSNSIETVSNYLNNYVDDNKLEYVIITHAHQDHYAGFATTTKVNSIFDLYECENIITFSKSNNEGKALYQNYERELNDEIANGANHFTAYECVNNLNGATNCFNIYPGVTLTILNSYFYEHNSSTENNYSVCCLFSHNGKNFLFTGDLEEDGEEYLVAMNDIPQVDLYKAGHHGSKTSSSLTLLNVIQPKNVCVCCCAGSSEYTSNKDNQFPTQQFIDNISLFTEKVYVTTLCIDYKNNKFTSFNGNIICFSTDINFTVNCSNNNTVLKDSQWFKTNRTTPSMWQ